MGPAEEVNRKPSVAHWCPTQTLWVHIQLFHILLLTTSTCTLPPCPAGYPKALEWAGSTWEFHVHPTTHSATYSQTQADMKCQSPAPLLQGRTNFEGYSCVLELPWDQAECVTSEITPSLGFFPFPLLLPRSTPKTLLVSPWIPVFISHIHPDSGIGDCFCRSST